MIARVHVTLKKGILDPQGKTVQHALENLGIIDLGEVRMGKLIELRFNDIGPEETRKRCEEACKKLLANPVIEEYSIELVPSEAVAG